MLKIGMVGCGAIGSALAVILEKRFRKIAKLSFLCDENSKQIDRLRRRLKRYIPSLAIPQIVRRSDLIVECASQSAARRVASLGMKYGKTMMILSVGGIIGLKGLRKKGSSGSIFIPSGAVGGVDALLAASESGLDSVLLSTSKPLSALKDAPFWKQKKASVKSVSRPTVLFEGSVREAVRLFPQNVNVAATVSLACGGSRRVRIRVVADPKAKRNRHEILAKGRFGQLRFVASNLPSGENPRTSALAIQSAEACLRKIFSRCKVGT